MAAIWFGMRIIECYVCADHLFESMIEKNILNINVAILVYKVSSIFNA
jgi:hypothetical protein